MENWDRLIQVFRKLLFARRYTDRFAILDRGRGVVEGRAAELSKELIKRHFTV